MLLINLLTNKIGKIVMYKFLALSFFSIGLVACNKTSEDSALSINNQEYMPKHQRQSKT